MADLFGKQPLSKRDKLKQSRRITTDLTRKVIDDLNASGLFIAWRSNNMPSPRIVREKKSIKAIDEDGHEYRHVYDDVQIMFKQGNIKQKILDISAFTTSQNLAGAGLHVEIEVKTGKDKLDSEQAERIESIKKAGGISFFFDSWETYLIQIAPFKKRKDAF